MINKKDFAGIRKHLENEDKKRENAIQLSREVIKASKLVIYALHRNNNKSAINEEKKMNKLVSKLQKMDFLTGMQKVAIQEYVEAKAFLFFVKKGRLITAKECGVDVENYLLGLCDLTGELMRKAVNSVIDKNETATYVIHELVEGIYGEFLKFNLRNSELRKKSDSIKWNLTKIEDIIFKLELRDQDD